MMWKTLLSIVPQNRLYIHTEDWYAEGSSGGIHDTNQKGFLIGVMNATAIAFGLPTATF